MDFVFFDVFLLLAARKKRSIDNRVSYNNNSEIKVKF